MGANRKHTPGSASTPGAMRHSGWVAQTASHANGISQCGNIEPAVFGGYDTDFRLEDTPLFYAIKRRDPSWAEGSSGAIPLGTGHLYGAGGKFTDTEVFDFSQGALSRCVPDTASTLTYSPPSSYQGSVLSSIQTDFISDIFSTGTPKSRDPSPLQVKDKISAETDGYHICPRDPCRAKFTSKRDLEIHSGVGHRHICLWGNTGPCSSAGFATTEELNWHVKREHLLLCPVPGCAEDTFASKDVLDCHLKYAHGNATAVQNATVKPVHLLETAPAPSESAVSSQTQTSIKNPNAIEEKTLEIKMSLDISKNHCRDRLQAVLEKRMKKANGGAPRTGEDTECHISKLLESASFPIIWEHSVLPFLVEFIPKWCGHGHVISVVRGRKPNSRRICIMTRQNVSRARRLVIASHVRDLLPNNHHDLVTFVFSVGEVNRVWSRGLSKDMPDDICLPRNPFCYTNPCMGDSIGTISEDGDEITATLGPCLAVGGGNFWLVNFHPFIDVSKGTQPVPIEHPSPADRIRCLDKRHEALIDGNLNFFIGNLTATSGFDLETTRVSHDPYWEECDKEPPLVVTDWALVSTKCQKANMLRKFPATDQNQETPIISMSSIVPGASVCSTGRTSGFQRGQVCEIPAYVDGLGNGTGKASREWYVEEPYPYDDEEAWICGGIGVEGDSGAAIIDSETNAMIGQLWGRNKYYGPGPRHTFFTPVYDILDDIREKCGEERQPQLPPYRDEAECWPVYPVCEQCFKLREYLESRRSSRESLMSMVGVHDGRAGDTDNEVTSVSELATPREASNLLRHVGLEATSPSFSGMVSPAPIHTFYPTSQTLSPGNTELRSPYAHALKDDDLYEKCPETNEAVTGILPTPMPRTSSRPPTKRRKVMPVSNNPSLGSS
ncbi:hypothetical protein F5Y00DRAFT_150901 [Daldinia vernicosa]|uniref:uncharacterized protein n=1 Tax=Daldinia vernicosa TaxID=114800 RepID=UPI0020077697|nr:uncharacterized protein F5Y00DRAFT_150901 [Daldinia vernicosa]KAI0846053.1 hypothetical protein F5Y00DRAFT_150901 [Daldinia vernicosa]